MKTFHEVWVQPIEQRAKLAVRITQLAKRHGKSMSESDVDRLTRRLWIRPPRKKNTVDRKQALTAITKLRKHVNDLVGIGWDDDIANALADVVEKAEGRIKQLPAINRKEPAKPHALKTSAIAKEIFEEVTGLPAKGMACTKFLDGVIADLKIDAKAGGQMKTLSR